MIVPNHVGIIVDGNGRWATKRGKSRSDGHLAGSKNLDSLCQLVYIFFRLKILKEVMKKLII